MYAPIEYDMIVAAGGREPLPELIEAVSYASLNPYFRSTKFRKSFITYYRNGGCHQEHAVKQTVERKRKCLRKRLEIKRCMI